LDDGLHLIADGMEITRATAFTKVVNLTSNLASLLVFVFMADA
jgi:hypothetical protein